MRVGLIIILIATIYILSKYIFNKQYNIRYFYRYNVKKKIYAELQKFNFFYAIHAYICIMLNIF